MRLDELVYVKAVLSEILGETAKSIPLHLTTDSKNLYKAVHNSTLAENARLRVDIAKIKDSLKFKELDGLMHVKNNDMLADTLTKKGASAHKLMMVLRNCTV